MISKADAAPFNSMPKLNRFTFSPDFSIENLSDFAEEVDDVGLQNTVRWCYAQFSAKQVMEETDTEHLLQLRRWCLPASQPRTDEEWNFISGLGQCVHQRLYQLNSKGTQTEDTEPIPEMCCLDFDDVIVSPRKDSPDHCDVGTAMWRMQ